MNVRTRIAPSPTGYPHIGTIYQALFDYAFAKKYKGKFVVRIEDTDRTRFIEGAENRIFEALDWFGLPEDESPRNGGPFSPYRQSERLEIYKKYAKELVERGGAYYCFCTKERLEELHETQEKDKKPTIYDRHCLSYTNEDVLRKLNTGTPHVIRLKIPDTKDFPVTDEIRGVIHFDLTLLEDAVLMKSDGYPTYHLAAMVDDHLMEITHVLRGEEWLSSLPKHILIYDYFGWKKPLFFHTPVLRNPDKSKLSKRQGHTNVSYYKDEGFLPEAILNYLSLMGWSPRDGKEIFSLDEFTQSVELKDLKPVAPIFDIKKLEWLNGEYIRSEKLKVISEKLRKFYRDDADVIKVIDDPESEKILELAKTRMKTLKDFRNLVIPEKIELSDEEKEIAKSLQESFEKIQDWNKESILDVMKETLQKYKIKGSILYKVLTGREQGLPLPESLEIIGKAKTIKKFSKIE